MNKAIEALLSQSLDYTGLLNKDLSVQKAVQEYQEAWDSSQGWILNRFVCPQQRLTELYQHLSLLDLKKEWSISIISDEFDSLEEQIKHIAEVSKTNSSTYIESIEVFLKDNELNEKNLSYLNHISQDFAEVFVDLPMDSSMLDNMHLIAEYSSLAIKANLTRELPTPKVLAQFLSECDHIDISFKVGDVLNAPFYGQFAKQDQPIHGFINILMVGALKETHEFSQKEIEALLCVQDPKEFHFNDQIFGWKNFTAPIPAIDSFRTLMISFTSSSWDQSLSFLDQHNYLESKIA